jgi:hypothetical protein
VVYSGWPDAVASRASTYVSETTWDRLIRGRRRQHCKALAELARNLLGLKHEIHSIFGWLASGVLALFGAGGAARALASELISHLPLPIDAKIIAAARGIQVTGILLCVVNGDDLVSCQCFVDLALDLTKTQVKRLLLAAAHDWTKLEDFPPSDPRRPTA